MSKYVDAIFDGTQSLHADAHEIRVLARAMSVLGLNAAQELFEISERIKEAADAINHAVADKAHEDCARSEQATANIVGMAIAVLTPSAK